MKNESTKIVCLGGGIGTVNLIKGLKEHFANITVVISMADEGGSSGRLRKLFNIFPPGDLVSCMSAEGSTKSPLVPKLLTYRFPGDRYGDNESLAGHKIGNLLMVALRDITGSFDGAIQAMQNIFDIPGVFLPATTEQVSISAKTIEGQVVHGEESIDLGKYEGERILDQVLINPANPEVSEKVLDAIASADVLIAGPGDLYTTILPVLIIPKIAKALQESKARKIFVVNVANKPFETKGYEVIDFVQAVAKHLEGFPFQVVIANNNYNIPIPEMYHYDYVTSTKKLDSPISFVLEDLIDPDFPLYHSSSKLANVVLKAI